MPHEDVHAAIKLVAELRKVSDDAEFFQELGRTFTNHRLSQHAKAAFDASLELDPCDGYTHLYLGNWFYRRRQYEPALERFEYAAELMPDEAGLPFVHRGCFRKAESVHGSGEVSQEGDGT